MNIREKIYRFFVKNGTGHEDADIAAYGFYNIVLFLSGIVVSVLVGIALNQTKGVLLFLLFFIPLRSYAGGFHTKSLISCGIISTLIVIAVALLMNTEAELNSEATIILFALMTGLLVYLSPQDCKSKILFASEKRKYKIIVISICFVYSLLTLVSIYYSQNMVAEAVMLAMLVCSTSLLAAFVSNKICRNKKMNRIGEN